MMENTLRIERAKKRISQKELAKAINVSQQSIYLIENGLMMPKLNMAFKIACFFNLRVEELFRND